MILLIAGNTANAQNKRFKNLIDVSTLDSTIIVDLMYTRADNFTGEVLYDFNKAYLHPQAAKAIVEANKLLKQKNKNWRLCIYDAARPMSVQQKMWNKVKGTPQQNYVSNPDNGGGLHNYGMAVDVTIIDIIKSDTIPMGTTIDAPTSKSHIDNENELIKNKQLTTEEYNNRRILRDIMTKAGFKSLRTEWWHFNLISRKEARKKYSPIR